MSASIGVVRGQAMEEKCVHGLGETTRLHRAGPVSLRAGVLSGSVALVPVSVGVLSGRVALVSVSAG